MLILDNFEDLPRAQAVLQRLQHPHLRLLLTSRRRDWPPTLGLAPLPLDEFTPEESRAFLRQWLPPERANDAALDALAERLGHLPLALELAARYLHYLHLKSVDAYLEELTNALDHRSLQGWKPERPLPTRHDLNLARTFALSWAQVRRPEAQRLLLAAGYCAPNEPLPLPALAALVADEETLQEALADLVALGLLKESRPPAIHPLVAEFARRQDTSQAVLRDLAEALADLATRTNDEADRKGDYHLFTPLVPHVRAVAARVEALGPQGPVPGEVAGRLWNSLGYHLRAIADYAGARAALERALRILEHVLGPEHPHVATLWNNLGLVLQDLGDLAGAKAAYQRALRILKASLGPDHPQVAIAVNNLGGALQALGDLAGAKAAFERALRIWEATLGPDHPQVATAVNNLGSVLQALGDLAGAKEAFERALRIFEQALGPEHPHVATLWNNLGGVLQDLGDLPGAKAAFERALRIDEVAFGPDHPNVAIRWNNLWRVLRDLGDLADAKEAAERALRIWEATLGPDHPQVAIALNSLGGVLRALGDLVGAKAAAERALRIDEAAFGPEHPNVATDVNNLGLVLRALGDLAGAQAAYQRALRILEKFLPSEHPHIRIVRQNLAQVQPRRPLSKFLAWLRRWWPRPR